jgi:two-component system, chemotaxis family, chemotaxis protein CheY
MADHSHIRRKLLQNFAVEVTRVQDPAEVPQRIEDGNVALVLVNRIIEQDRTEGLALVRDMQQRDVTRDVPVMLVSDHEQAQAAAVATGAVPGFGKSDLGTDRALARLRPYLPARADGATDG